MELVFANKILADVDFRERIEKINFLEKYRIFCGHGIEHLLDTARIALILFREQSIDVSPDIIYCAALLHDTGRAEQYENGVPHHIASLEFAEKILKKAGADKSFTEQVMQLIGSHRKSEFTDKAQQLFALADKKSRRCFMCNAREKCKWNDSKKNLVLEV